MSTARRQAQAIETQFLAGVQSKLAQPGRPIRGSRLDVREDYDAGDVRAALVDSGRFDRDLEREFPGCRSIVARGYETRWLIFTREVSRTMACVIAPPRSLVEDRGAAPAPVGLAELREFVRRRAGSSRLPVTVAVCSPSGFGDDVWNAEWDQPNVRVVLAAPRPGGGWRLRGLWKDADERLVHLFDPEPLTDKLERVQGELASRSHELMTGGLSAREMARKLDLPMVVLAQALDAAARQDRELQVRRTGDDLVVFRGAAAGNNRERGGMSVTDWVRSLFDKGGDEARKINMLSERRALLSQKRDRMYDDIGKLEAREADLVRQGKETTSTVVRRRLAAQIAQLRRDISRANTTAAMLNQQVNVISTHIHNLTLIQQGEMAKLPSAEELTEDAVKAEELLETLRADADLVGNLETGVAEAMLTGEEQAILDEFEQKEAVAGREVAGEELAKAQSAANIPAQAAPAAKEKSSALEDDVAAIERELAASEPPPPMPARRDKSGPAGDTLKAE